MKKIILKNNIPRMLFIKHLIRHTGLNKSGRSALIIVLAAILSLPACEKDDGNGNENMVKAATSIRLVNSTAMIEDDPLTPIVETFIPGMPLPQHPVDLYVDGVKINTTATIAYSTASGYFPTSSGAKKIQIKNTVTGTAIIDTTLNIDEGKQYSLFIKDRSWVYPADNTTTPPTPAALIPFKRQVEAIIDNNTTVPAAEKAKVRFVNTSSLPANVLQGTISFSRISISGSTTTNTVLTQALGQSGGVFYSDYAILDAGPITFRAQALTDVTYLIDLTTTLEAGKLYTVYVMSTPSLVKTNTQSPLLLKIVANN